jgi:hypothetical protein
MGFAWANDDICRFLLTHTAKLTCTSACETDRGCRKRIFTHPTGHLTWNLHRLLARDDDRAGTRWVDGCLGRRIWSTTVVATVAAAVVIVGAR